MEHPFLLGYQLMGCSNMVRFFSTITNQRPYITYQRHKMFGTFCSNHLTLRLLQKQIFYNISNVSQNLIISIGTNDVIRGTSVGQFKLALRYLLQHTKDKRIIFLEIAPLLKFARSKMHNRRRFLFNKVLKQAAKRENVSFISTAAVFGRNYKIRRHLYAKYHYGFYRFKPDRIHFNKRGHWTLLKYLESVIPRVDKTIDIYDKMTEWASWCNNDHKNLFDV